MDAKPDPNSFSADADCVGVVLPGERLFGLLTRSCVVPSGWVALTNPAESDSTLHPATATVVAAGVRELLLVRTEPVSVEIGDEQTPSVDGYLCAGTVLLALRAVAQAGDLKLFRRSLMAGTDRVDRQALAKYLRWQSRRVMAEFAEKRTAADLVDGKDRDAVVALLTERLSASLFAAGLVFHQPPLVSFDCGALRQVRRECEVVARRRDEQAAHQQLQDALAEARRKHLSQLEELLGQLQSLSTQTPSIQLADVIRTFSEPQRGQIYDGLWTLLPAEERTQWIVAVAGNELLCFDPNLPDAPARRRQIDGPAGALRSVRFYRSEKGRAMLLVGAAHGVYEVSVHDLKVRAAHTFEPPAGQELRGGVNASAVWNARVFATHSQIGLIAWDRAIGDQAAFLLPDLTRRHRAVRGVHVVGTRLIFSVDDIVVVCPVAQVVPSQVRRFTGSIARITAVHAVDDDIFAGNEIGDLWHWHYDRPAEGRCIRRGDGSPVEGFQQISAGGVSHLVFAERGTPALQSMVVGDTFVCRYETGGEGVRRCAVAGDVFVAIDDLRDRLICWRPGGAKAPYAVIAVAAQCGHTIQDVCLVTETLFA